MQETVKTLKEKAHSIRNDVLDMCVNAGTGHVTSCFSCVEILVALYYGGILNYKLDDLAWDDRDRFILSKGQASPLLYVVLADLGFFPREKLKTFCKADGMFGVHLQNDVPGVEISSGSLGHGLGIAAGLALRAKMDGKDHRVFTLIGDGECHEGSIWETAMFASHHKLDNLIAITDRNKFCVTSSTEDIVHLNPLVEKWEAFDWDVCCVDGHSLEELLSVLQGADSRTPKKPLMIIADTVKGKGIPFMENKALWHGLAPKGDEAILAKKELNERCEQ